MLHAAWDRFVGWLGAKLQAEILKALGKTGDVEAEQKLREAFKRR